MNNEQEQEVTWHLTVGEEGGEAWVSSEGDYEYVPMDEGEE
jgi:hypothetical protein